MWLRNGALSTENPLLLKWGPETYATCIHLKWFDKFWKKGEGGTVKVWQGAPWAHGKYIGVYSNKENRVCVCMLERERERERERDSVYSCLIWVQFW